MRPRIVLLWMLLLAGAAFAADDDDKVSRAELEARAHSAENRLADLNAQLKATQEAAERNLHSIHELQGIVAEMKGKQTAWGTILTLLSSSGVIVTLFRSRRKN